MVARFIGAVYPLCAPVGESGEVGAPIKNSQQLRLQRRPFRRLCYLTNFPSFEPMKPVSIALLSFGILISASTPAENNAPEPAPAIFGFHDATAELSTESRFLAVPDPKLAEEHLRTLTQAP